MPGEQHAGVLGHIGLSGNPWRPAPRLRCTYHRNAPRWPAANCRRQPTRCAARADQTGEGREPGGHEGDQQTQFAYGVHGPPWTQRWSEFDVRDPDGSPADAVPIRRSRPIRRSTDRPIPCSPVDGAGVASHPPHTCSHTRQDFVAPQQAACLELSLDHDVDAFGQIVGQRTGALDVQVPAVARQGEPGTLRSASTCRDSRRPCRSRAHAAPRIWPRRPDIPRWSRSTSSWPRRRRRPCRRSRPRRQPHRCYLAPAGMDSASATPMTPDSWIGDVQTSGDRHPNRVGAGP